MGERCSVNEIRSIVENACRRDSNVFGYGIWTHHIVYVVEFARQLGEKLGADQEIVEVAALLHDYASIKDSSFIEDHHIHGAAEAGRILGQLGYPKDRIEKVKECILTHRGSVRVDKRTVEAECIASADAMAHIVQVPSLLHVAYVRKGMDIDEGKQWVLGKIERSMNKLCREGKELVNDHYLMVKAILE